MLNFHLTEQMNTHPTEGPPTNASTAIWMIAFAVLVMSLAVGYGVGVNKKPRSTEPSGGRRIAVDTTAATKVAVVADSTGPVVAVTAPPSAPETVLVAEGLQVDSAYHGETEDPDLIMPVAKGFQTIVPPAEPPQWFRPSDTQLIEMLYGQQLIVSRQLLRPLTWTIEPGEITDFVIVSDWQDPEQVSQGVRIKFVAQANGAGIRAAGLLRYYGYGTEGDGYRFRDFLLEDIERFGRW